MAIRQMRTATPAAPAAQPGKFDPSTWAGQARALARNEADALALRIALALAALALALIGGATLLDARLPRDPTGILVLAGACVACVAGAWMWTYARALARNTHHVRLATWQMELEQKIDLDGDGVLGPPPSLQPVGHVMRIGGPKPVDVILPDLDPPREARPLAGFPICPNDVLFILNRAAVDGLTVRAWAGQRLPSGLLVDRTLWSAVVDGLVEWAFATATVDGAGRRRVELRTDVSVDLMADAVQKSLAAG